MLVALLWVLVLTLIGFLLAACHKIEVLQERARFREASDHAICIMQIANVVSDRHSAETLRHAAHAWNSPAEQRAIVRLGREEYTAGGPSVPMLWLQRRADQIDPLPIDFEEVQK